MGPDGDCTRRPSCLSLCSRFGDADDVRENGIEIAQRPRGEKKSRRTGGRSSWRRGRRLPLEASSSSVSGTGTTRASLSRMFDLALSRGPNTSMVGQEVHHAGHSGASVHPCCKEKYEKTALALVTESNLVAKAHDRRPPGQQAGPSQVDQNSDVSSRQFFSTKVPASFIENLRQLGMARRQIAW